MKVIEGVSTVDRVTSEIRHAIISGDIGPGSRLLISDLARRLEVSHIPVREAFRRLESEGLIVLRHSRQAVVTPLSSEDLSGIYRIRKLLEPDLCARGVDAVDTTFLDRLYRLWEMHETYGADAERGYAIHREFHFEIFHLQASQWDLRILRSLWSASERYVRLMYAQTVTEHRRHDARARHDRLLSALSSRDAAQVHAEVLNHLTENEEAILRLLEAEGSQIDTLLGRASSAG